MVQGDTTLYVFVRSGTDWIQQTHLTSTGNSGFGGDYDSVDIDGDTIVVGSMGDGSNATGVNGNQFNNLASASGAVYVFVRSGSTWTQQAYLKASNPDSSDMFGFAVAIDGDTLVVGAPGEDSNATTINGNQADNSASGSGAVYAFLLPGFTVGAASGHTTEAGGTATFSVHLNTQPSGNVVLNLVSSDTGEGTVASSITFNGSDWSTPKNVTVSGVDDNGIDGNTSYNVALTINTGLTADSYYDLLNPPDVALVNDDNDVASLITVGPGGIPVRREQRPALA